MKPQTSKTLPPPAGPYSHFRRVGLFVFVSGQIPVRPDTGELVTSPAEAAQQALDNLQAVLQAAGSSLAHVVKTTVFLIDLRDFAAVNEVYGRSFGAHPPARSCVQVAALPKGARLEIEAVAVAPTEPNRPSKLVRKRRAEQSTGAR